VPTVKGDVGVLRGLKVCGQPLFIAPVKYRAEKCRAYSLALVGDAGSEHAQVPMRFLRVLMFYVAEDTQGSDGVGTQGMQDRR